MCSTSLTIESCIHQPAIDKHGPEGTHSDRCGKNAGGVELSLKFASVMLETLARLKKSMAVFGEERASSAPLVVAVVKTQNSS